VSKPRPDKIAEALRVGIMGQNPHFLFGDACAQKRKKNCI
jgi:hypothetical protein